MDFYEDAQATTITQEALSRLSHNISRALSLQAEVESLTTLLKKRSTDLRLLLTRDLPDAMVEAQLTEFTSFDGHKVELKQIVDANITAAKKNEALEWLLQHGHGDLIKDQLKCELGKGKHNLVLELKSMLERDYAIDADVTTGVNPQTLKAFVREQLQQGANLPEELFGVFIGREAKITKPKEKKI